VSLKGKKSRSTKVIKQLEVQFLPSLKEELSSDIVKRGLENFGAEIQVTQPQN